MLTVHEAAESLGISPVTVRRAWREGRLAGRKTGQGRTSRLVISPESVEAYRQRHLGKVGLRMTDPRRGVS